MYHPHVVRKEFNLVGCVHFVIKEGREEEGRKKGEKDWGGGRVRVPTRSTTRTRPEWWERTTLLRLSVLDVLFTLPVLSRLRGGL